ncbi:MAG: ABC transporter substrate-binding protein [Anaerolineae bacterium]
MKQRKHRRLMVLVVSGVIMALIWVIVGTGCDGTPPPPDKDEVRRREVQVWAGSPGNNPPLLANDNWKDLSAGDSVRTDGNGEAELRLVGCDGSVWVFDNSTLSVWTCTKKAELDKEYWCTEEGTAGFNISCSSRFDVVDTPSAQVNIKATAFTITYLPERQLTLVTVLRGVVTVAPVLDMDTLEIGEPVPVEAGYFLYTMPGGVSPEIGEVPAREPRPLYELPLIVYELGIRGWMDNVTRWAETEQLLEPWWPFQGVTIDFDDGQLADARIQEAFVGAIDQEAVLASAFPNEDVRFIAIISGAPVEAFTIPYDPERALALLEEAGYPRDQAVFIVFPEEDGQVATAAKLVAGDLSRIDIPVELYPAPTEGLAGLKRELINEGVSIVMVYR